MIISVYLLLGLFCWCNLPGVTTISLTAAIICRCLIIALILYWKMGSLIGLIWIMLYLGGIIVCFVFILFIRDIANKPQPKEKDYSSGIWAVQPFLLILVFFKGITLKGISLHCFDTNSWRGRIILFRESYSQVICQSHFFFITSLLIIFFRLLQILSMLGLKEKDALSSIL